MRTGRAWAASLAIAAAGAALALAVPAPARADAPASAPAWEKIGDDDGIAVFRREVPGSDVIAFRGEGIVDATPLKVASVLVDVDRAPEWVDSLVEARRVRVTSPTDFVEWDHFATPPIVMKDRDFVFRNDLRVGADGTSLVLAMQSVDEPNAPKTKHIRGEVMHSSAVLAPIEGGKRTRIVAEAHVDPKGSVPKWIVNWVQKDWPHSTIARLRKQVQKPYVVESAALREALVARGWKG